MIMETVLGIDIGGTNTKFGLVDRSGDVLVSGSMPTNSHFGLSQFMFNLACSINEGIKSSANELVVKGVGIGAPNGNYFHGTIEHAPNLDWEGVVPFVTEFKKYFDLPMVLTNDANAAALGEKVFGKAKELDDFIVITLGTGLGSGFFANGKLIYGHDGMAGELGHINVDPNGRICNCGKSGCLETYASAEGLKRTMLELIREEELNTQLSGVNPNELTAEDIAKAASNDDEVALKAFDVTARILALKLGDAAIITNPKSIFITGGLAKAGDVLIKPTKDYFESFVYRGLKNKVNIELSGLLNKNAAVLGAAALVWAELSDSGSTLLWKNK